MVVFVSWVCCDKYGKAEGLKGTKTNSLVDLGVSAGPPPSAGSRGAPSHLLQLSGTPTRVSGVVASSSLMSTSVVTWLSSLGLVSPSSLYKDSSHWVQVDPESRTMFTNHWEPYGLHLERPCFQHSEVLDVNLGGHYPAP